MMEVFGQGAFCQLKRWDVMAALAPVKGAPTQFIPRQEGATNTPTTGSFQKQNALDAQKLNAQFSTLKETDSCTGELVNDIFLCKD